MNHLAHLLLAGPEPDHRLGALLGDHVKGRLALADWPGGVRRGVILHRRIDAWSDSHPAVTGLLAGLQPPWRRYGGVMLDVLFDHFLTRHWDRFAQPALPDFAREVDGLLLRHRASLPPRLARFSAWARQVGLWQRYGEREMLAEIFRLLGKRHGRPSPLPRGLELLDSREAEIETAFLELFPDLQRRSAEFLADP